MFYIYDTKILHVARYPGHLQAVTSWVSMYRIYGSLSQLTGGLHMYNICYIAHLQQQCHNSKSLIFQDRLVNVLKRYNFLWVQQRHNCSLVVSFANCVMTLYLLKVHLQTFLSIPVTQKCQILSCDTFVANERYVQLCLHVVFIIWKQQMQYFDQFWMEFLHHHKCHVRRHVSDWWNYKVPILEKMKMVVDSVAGKNLMSNWTCIMV